MNDGEQKKLVKATILGTIWVYAANYSGKALVFLSTVILARLLTQADYGLAGYALVVIGFLDVLIDLGIGAALVYYPEDERVKDTAFWLNIASGGALYALTWAIAPLAGAFFQDERAVALTRVLALTFPITSLGNIHSALLIKNLTFQRKFFPDFVKALGKGIIAIILAWMGYGPWSLVIGQVGGTAIGVLAYWLVYPWRPALRFNPTLARPLLRYGVNIVAVDSLGVTLNNVDYLFVGRLLGAEALGVYTLAFRIPELLVKNFCNLVGQVLFPAYSKLQEDTQALSSGFLVSMRTITLVTAPIAAGLAVISRPLVLTLFTAKWEEAISVLSAIALYTLIRSLTFNIGNVYKAQGRPDILTKLSLLKVPFLLVALWWAAVVEGSIVAVGWAQVGVAVIAGVMNIFVASRALNTPIFSILAAFWPAIIASALMAGAVWGVLLLLSPAANSVQLIVGIATGVLVYGGAIWWLQRDFVRQATSSLKAAFSRT